MSLAKSESNKGKPRARTSQRKQGKGQLFPSPGDPGVSLCVVCACIHRCVSRNQELVPHNLLFYCPEMALNLPLQLLAREPPGPAVLCSPMLGVTRICSHVWHFLCGYWGLKLRSFMPAEQVFLPPEPSANSYIFSSFYKVIDFSFICFYYYVKSALSNTQENS